MPRTTRGEESDAMGFYEVRDQVVQLLRQRGRVTYRALKREFQLDDAFLEYLKDELIKAQRLKATCRDRGQRARRYSSVKRGLS
jgi:hypothetical protein